MRLYLLIILCMVLPSANASTTSDTTKWKSAEHGYRFAIRCSEGPRKTTLGRTETFWFDQIYISWDGVELKRLAYSTAMDNPHYWHSDEDGYVYVQKSHDGDSIIDVTFQERLHSGKKLEAIEISLDASGSPEISHFLTGFFTHGSWIISADGEDASLKENTSTFRKGKLLESNSSSWARCRLMKSYGEL